MHTVGIDIGGTQLRAAVLSDKYEILEVHKVPNDRTISCEQNMDRILGFLKELNMPFRGIGIGSPGPIDATRGLILSPPNLVGWDNFPVVDYVEQHTGHRAVLDNDGNVAALAEAVFGGGRGYDSVVYVTISTGVGGGYVYHGEIVGGANSNAAELWNLIVSDDEHCHKNASPGSLNEQCSGSGLAVLAEEHYGEPTGARELFEKYAAGDVHAKRIVMHGVEMMARGFANIMCMMDPDVVVVGGSVARHNPWYVSMAAERARRYLIASDSLNIVEARFGDDAGLIGAALNADRKAGRAPAAQQT